MDTLMSFVNVHQCPFLQGYGHVMKNLPKMSYFNCYNADFECVSVLQSVLEIFFAKKNLMGTHIQP